MGLQATVSLFGSRPPCFGTETALPFLAYPPPRDSSMAGRVFPGAGGRLQILHGVGGFMFNSSPPDSPFTGPDQARGRCVVTCCDVKCTSLIINCVSERPNCTGTFQCRSMNEHATPRSLSSEESGRGSRRSGCLVVVVVSLFALLGRCVVRRSTGRRLFFVFRSRVTSPRASRSSARSVRWAVLLCRPAIAGIPLR